MFFLEWWCGEGELFLVVLDVDEVGVVFLDYVFVVWCFIGFELCVVGFECWIFCEGEFVIGVEDVYVVVDVVFEDVLVGLL